MEEDYESLPSGSTLSTHLAAGAAAGIMEHAVMYPVDCVKTRMQVLVPDPRANYRNVPEALLRIARHEGPMNTLRGINAVVSGAGPAHALYFACYEWIKKSLSSNHGSNHLVHGLAGCCATVLHDTVMNPAEVIKQRMQVYNSPYKGCMECMKTVYRTEGLTAFYRSYTTQLTMNIPFQALHFMVYETCQDYLNPDRHYNAWTHMVSGGLAGGLAAAATTPLDVCKTLLNTQQFNGVTTNPINGMVHAFRTVYACRGLVGYFQGVSARVIYVMPGTAIAWSIYELFKATLTRRDDYNSGFVTTSSVQVHAAPPSGPLRTGVIPRVD